MPEVQAVVIGAAAPAPPVSPKTLRLAVGPFASDGAAFRELMIYQGEKLAEIRSEGTKAFWGIRSQPSMYVIRTLYGLEGTLRFAVHSVLYSRRDQRAKLAHLDIYPEWNAVSLYHADLVRTAAQQDHAGMEADGLRGEVPQSEPTRADPRIEVPQHPNRRRSPGLNRV
jgi:hypothetical protein